MRSVASGLIAESMADPGDWLWLRSYLRLDEPLGPILSTFPRDPAMVEAVRACRGLRILRQDPWECLASFILSSTKQVVQIRQIVELLCRRFGQNVPSPAGCRPAYSFPTPCAIAAATERSLRACKMGFRAPYLMETARQVAEGRIDLADLPGLSLAEARDRLMGLPGVGRKIADCVLLFACGFPEAFPVDVWVSRALRELYFAGRNPRPAEVLDFSERYFGEQGGYAQQYLFHYMRLRAGRVAAATPFLAGCPRDAG
jgi:N-glycosylase/DNA lyase